MFLLAAEVLVVLCGCAPDAFPVGAVCEPLLRTFAAAASARFAFFACVYVVVVVVRASAFAAGFLVVLLLSGVRITGVPVLSVVGLIPAAVSFMCVFAY